MLMSVSIAQTGVLKGKIMDRDSHEEIPFSKVEISDGERQFFAQTDFDGNFTINGIPEGKYTVRVSSIGYDETVKNDVHVMANKITVLDETVLTTSRCICHYVIQTYAEPRYSNPAIPK